MSDTDEWAFSEGAEFRRGNHANENDEVYRHAGVVLDAQTRRRLSRAKAAFDRLVENGELPPDAPASFYDTRKARQILRVAGTETFSKAVDSGDSAAVRGIVGSQDAQADLSGWEPIKQFISIFKDRPTPMLYIAGEPGTGKSQLAAWLLELWKDHVAPDGVVASNIKSLEQQDQHVSGYTELDTWLRQDGMDTVLSGDAVPKAVLIDEASSALTAIGAKGHAVREHLGPMIYKIRRFVTNNGMIIWVGHDKGDVHPLFRELAIYCEKHEAKEMTLYNGVRNRSGVDKIASFSGIPKGNWRFNQHEKPDFAIDPGSDTKDEDMQAAADTFDEHTGKETAIYTAIQAKRNGATDREAAKYVPYERSWVNSRWQEYQNAELDDVMDRVEVRLSP